MTTGRLQPFTSRVLAALTLACALLVASPAVAQQQTPQKPTAAQEGFVPVESLPPAQDTMPAPRLVGAAYAFVWIMVFGYMWSIWHRLGTVERELASVSKRVAGGSRR